VGFEGPGGQVFYRISSHLEGASRDRPPKYLSSLTLSHGGLVNSSTAAATAAAAAAAARTSTTDYYHDC
jgi:hypothetical protein